MRSQVARAVAAAGFVRDVRDGMAEYWDLHRGEPDPTADGRSREGRTLEGRTLEADSDQALSGGPAGSGEGASRAAASPDQVSQSPVTSGRALSM